MAKFTNKQLDLLSEKIVDELYEIQKQKEIDLKKSPEYQNFEAELEKNDSLYKELNRMLDIINKKKLQQDMLTKDISKLQKEMHDLISKEGYVGHQLRSWGGYRYLDGEELIASIVTQKREEKFGDQLFDREKMLRKIQAEILLGDSSDASSVFDNLVTKFSTNEHE